MLLAPRSRARALAWSFTLALAAPLPRARAEVSVHPDVAYVLFDLGDDGAVEVDRLFAALQPLGVDAVREVIAALDSAYVAGTDGQLRRLERRRSDELASALAELPAFVLRLEFGGELAPAARTPAVEIALSVVGALGREDQLSTAFALAETSTANRLERRIARALECCLVEFLGRHPAAHQRLGTRFRDVQPALRWTVVRAVGEARLRQGFGFFAQVLGEHPELDPSILSELGRLAAAHRPPHDWSLQLRLRAYLGSTDPVLRREAAGTLARMEDRESFGAILELLSDSDHGVRANALWAARALSGRSFGPERDAWQLWYEEQMTWWRGRAQELLTSSTAGSGSARLRALGELASRPFFRHELAKELALVLGRRDDVALLAATCATLADLGSPVALPALVELLEHRAGEVRERAWVALREITGEDLPAETAAWLAVLP